MSPAGVDLQNLPSDPEVLRAMLVATMARCEALVEERDSITTERDALAARNEKLRYLLGKLQRMQFGQIGRAHV